MSVLIKGMEMPRNCLECEMKAWKDDLDGYVCLFSRYACQFSRIICPSIGRQDNCPLVELPEKHGRLIDADELKTAFPTCDNSKPILVASVRATINHMPTVIEAEGE